MNKALALLGIAAIVALLWFSIQNPAEPRFGDNTSALSPGTMADDSSVGTLAWSNVDNAKVSDNTYSTATAAASTTTHYLKATNFGFSIPAGATINGILVEFERKKELFTNAVDKTIKIVKSDGSIGTTNKSTGVAWSSSEAYVSFGNSSDLWGETWTSTDINDTDFGVVLSAETKASPDGGQIDVDHIRITVTYTPAVTSTDDQTQIRTASEQVRTANIEIR